MEIIVKQIETDLSAFDLYSLFRGPDIIFLDSAKDPERLGRYSFIGLNPFKKITYKDGLIEEDHKVLAGDPFLVLNQVLDQYKVANKTHLPFIGGCMGYMAYDLAKDLDQQIPSYHKASLKMPALYFVFYENMIVVDHLRQQVFLTELKKDVLALSRLDAIALKIHQAKANPIGPLMRGKTTFTSLFSRESYMKAVEEMRQYIRRGDIYIANMTHTYRGTSDREGFDIYKVLRHLNPAPFSAYMPLDGFEVLCSSPERFIQIIDGHVQTRPIKGTRPRSPIEAIDQANRDALKASEKDRSELLMVVDLERNDLSKVCQPFSVKVTELFEIESYATVHHLVATIEGQLEATQTPVDCMKACFPGGSITGTPKIRAMEIIEELERSQRHLYTGSIGYFGFDGHADFNIVIRTILKENKDVHIGVGGGITWESDPAAEYEETLDKAAALFEAIETVEVEHGTID